MIFSRKEIDINGNEVDLTHLNDSVVLVVNTASACGLTPQLTELQEIYSKYKDKGFVVLGVPSNNFGSQEPLANEEITQVYNEKYSVDFPLLAKTNVVEGEINPLFQTLIEQTGNKPEWNFSKYLVNRGKDVIYYAPTSSYTDVEKGIEVFL